MIDNIGQIRTNKKIKSKNKLLILATKGRTLNPRYPTRSKGKDLCINRKKRRILLLIYLFKVDILRSDYVSSTRDQWRI